ncbi:MAG TPA: amidohydrolase family protein [Polyangia bacterium]|nr:amidohydrolase family protein [Polyangia bacterium]
MPPGAYAALTRRQFVAGTLWAGAAGTFAVGCDGSPGSSAGLGSGGAGAGGSGSGGSVSPGGSGGGAGGGAGGGGAGVDAAGGAAGDGAATPADGADGPTANDGPSSVAPGTIIDAHAHFWNRGGDVKLPPDLERVAKPLGVTGVVAIEASADLTQNDFVLGLAANDTFLVGYSGRGSIGTPGFATLIRKYAADQFFRGVRIGDAPFMQAANSDAVFSDMKLLADMDLHVEGLIQPGTLPAITALAPRLPTLRIIVDHVAGMTYNGGAVPPAFIANMTAAGAHPNVYCKVSALAEGTGNKTGTAPKDPGFYAPLLDEVWKAFGDDHLLYASNWPVCLRAATYDTVFGIAKGYVSTKSQEAAEKFFARNALAAYKWIAR